jgi:hypothetical protein
MRTSAWITSHLQSAKIQAPPRKLPMNYNLQLLKDPHGQPAAHLHLRTNIAKAIDQLSGLCSGILADGVVTDDEIRVFKQWVDQCTLLEGVYPFTEIFPKVDRLFANGFPHEDGRAELRAIIEAVCGHSPSAKPGQTYSTKLPFCDPPPGQIYFPGRTFVITGKFECGPRKDVFESIRKFGGLPTASSPTRTTHYLVVGKLASRDWCNSNHGRKIEKAVELREAGSGIAIIGEDYWRTFFA